ncbi:hypothetical protein AB0C12_10880 [Actinoplanes sp. NPDC048967]|uniref:hypothetical protein n=1 Tax=Actinoplanes sp. NPDC048967 TaxID=3155269 RepID=UPI0033F2BB80
MMVSLQIVAAESTSWADPVAALAAAAAALITAFALFYQAKALKEERKTRRDEDKRFREEQEAARDAQARAVVLHDVLLVGSDRLGLTEYRVMLGNYGSAPITDVAGHLQRVEDGRTDLDQVVRRPVLVAGAADSLAWDLRPYEMPWPSTADAYARAATFTPRADFTDVYGIRRTCAFTRPAGQPVRLEDPDQARPQVR